MNINQQIQDAINNLRNETELTRAWIIWAYICYLISLIAPAGWVCPFSQSTQGTTEPPTLFDLLEAANDLETEWGVPPQ